MSSINQLAHPTGRIVVIASDPVIGADVASAAEDWADLWADAWAEDIAVDLFPATTAGAMAFRALDTVLVAFLMIGRDRAEALELSAIAEAKGCIAIMSDEIDGHDAIPAPHDLFLPWPFTTEAIHAALTASVSARLSHRLTGQR